LKATLAATINAEEVGYKSNPAVERILTTIQELHPVRILDFGGGMGKFYFTLRSKIPGVNWDVVEPPATVQVARNLKNEELHFYSSIAAAPKPDLVIASGSLQY
jgi:putative methyltransferase (TIGR04325 family)